MGMLKRMVTFAFFLVSIFLIILLTSFDMKLFEFSFMEAIKNILFSEISAGRYIVIIGGVVGFFSSIFIDIRLYLLKKLRKNTEGNQVP